MIEDVLDQVIAHGDLFEYRDLSSGVSSSVTVLHAAPCAFVLRASGSVMLLGIAADQLTALPDELAARVKHKGHVRYLDPHPGEALQNELSQLGLIEISCKRWSKGPAEGTATRHLSRLNSLLDTASSSGQVAGLVIIDPSTNVGYYRGRWTEPKHHSGRFVGRRSQAYGAPLWCYVQIDGGRPVRLIDFPETGSRWRGCDEAWHLQMAIDAERQVPQRVRISPSSSGMRRFEVFAPIPMWAQRRWDALGERVDAKGCLFAIEMPEREADEEARYARDALWLEIESYERKGSVT